MFADPSGRKLFVQCNGKTEKYKNLKLDDILLWSINKIIWYEYSSVHQTIILGLYIFLDQWPSSSRLSWSSRSWDTGRREWRWKRRGKWIWDRRSTKREWRSSRRPSAVRPSGSNLHITSLLFVLVFRNTPSFRWQYFGWNNCYQIICEIEILFLLTVSVQSAQGTCEICYLDSYQVAVWLIPLSLTCD